MKKTSSMSKDGSNLSESCFGCYFHHSLVNQGISQEEKQFCILHELGHKM